MFFHREKARTVTFQERIDALAPHGFKSQRDSSGGVLVTRGECGAVVTEAPGGRVLVVKDGILMGGEIAELVSAGYQMFLMTRGGKRAPARAEQLQALHGFSEDLKETLGVESLYNEGLGTTTARHLYDRVDDRDLPGPKEPWRAVKADAAYETE